MSSGASCFQPVDPCMFRINPYDKIQNAEGKIIYSEEKAAPK